MTRNRDAIELEGSALHSLRLGRSSLFTCIVAGCRGGAKVDFGHAHARRYALFSNHEFVSQWGL